MKIKGRGILVISLLVLLAYAGYDYWKSDKQKTQKMNDQRLMTLNFDQISTVNYTRGHLTIRLKRGVDGWTMEQPIQDLADSTAVEDYIKSIATDRILDVATEGENIDWARYGLNKPEAVVNFVTEAGQAQTFVVSEMKNFENNPFLRRDEENRVLVVPGSWFGKADKKVLDFQDRRFLRHRIGGVDKMKLKNPQGIFEIGQDNGQWVLLNNKKQKLDQNKVREHLMKIADAKGASYLDSSKTFDSDKFMMDLELTMGGKVWTAKVRQQKDLKIVAKVSDPALMMIMEPGALDDLIKMTLKDLEGKNE